jgi:hypothetical protein
MPIIQEASTEDLQHLLQLFPVAKLRAHWSNVKGSKEEISSHVSAHIPRGDLLQFVSDNFSCCKQHAYVFSPHKKLKGPPDVNPPSGERVHGDDGQPHLYVVRVVFSLVMQDPLEQAAVEFLWPIRMEIVRGHLIVRFVTMEKNLSSYFGGRSCWVTHRSVDSEDFLQAVSHSINGLIAPTDLHKGIKKLWQDGFVDCPRARYKKPHSTASEVMDEGRGIRASNPELYETLKKAALLDALFQVNRGSACTVSVFHMSPLEGLIVFPRYSEKKGDTDHVIKQILENN